MSVYCGSISLNCLVFWANSSVSARYMIVGLFDRAAIKGILWLNTLYIGQKQLDIGQKQLETCPMSLNLCPI